MARILIIAQYDAVWDRLVTASEYRDCYSSPCREFGKAPGQPVVWGSEIRVVYRGQLEAIAKGRGLRHTFAFQGFGFVEPETTVAVRIVEQGPVVLVEVRHDCRNAPRTRAMITEAGWQKSLSRLKTLLETGRAMPWPEN